MSENVVNKMIKEKLTNKWGSMWKISETGEWTRELINQVGNKLRFPRDRNTAISYVRLLVNNTSLNENMFRFNLVDSKDCDCGEGIQTVEHVLLSCKKRMKRGKYCKRK